MLKLVELSSGKSTHEQQQQQQQSDSTTTTTPQTPSTSYMRPQPTAQSIFYQLPSTELFYNHHQQNNQQQKQQHQNIPEIITTQYYNGGDVNNNSNNLHEQRQANSLQPSSSSSQRSLSEPRHPVPLPAAATLQQVNGPHHQHLTPSHAQIKQYTTNKLVSALNDCSSEANATLFETYDNLSSGETTTATQRNATNYSRSNSSNKNGGSHSYNYNYFDRYGNARQPIYSSMRVPNSSSSSASRGVKSIDQNLMMFYESLNQQDLAELNNNNNTAQQQQSISHVAMGVAHLRPHHNQAPRHRHSLFNSSLMQQAMHSRDIKSCDREFMREITSNGSIMKTTPQQTPTCIRAGSMTPNHNRHALMYQQHQQQSSTEPGIIHKQIKLNYELENLSSESSEHNYAHSLSNSSEDENKAMTTGGGANDFALVNSVEAEEDEVEEDYETSKVKMKQMQRQLEQLTSLVNQALMDRDLNQLASIVNSQYSSGGGSGVKGKESRNDVRKFGVENLNEKTKVLKNDLLTIKQMQENLKHLFGDSMKGFVNQLNVKKIKF